MVSQSLSFIVHFCRYHSETVNIFQCAEIWSTQI